MRRSLSVLAVAATTLALLACSGDDGGEATPTGTASVTPTTSTGASATGATPTPTATPTAADEFTALLDGLSDAQYRISYSFTSNVNGEELLGALTWVRAADGRERFETSSEQAGEAFILVVITAADGSQITCFDVGGFASCFEGDDGPFAELPNPAEIIFQNVLDPARIDGVRESGSRDILGVDTTCYEVDAGGGTSEACIAEGHLLLSASWTAANGDSGGFEATEFSTDVSDEDFEPTEPIEN